MKKLKKVAIVIPTQKSHLNKSDLLSLRHLQKYLDEYDKYFVTPYSTLKTNVKLKKVRFVKFQKNYFLSPKTYNKLLLCDDFYKAFSSYEYILIYQLDALVFSNQLKEWCNKEFSYIGAPWVNSIIGRLTHMKTLPANGGNGGFSLRNVEMCRKVLRKVKGLSTKSSANHLIQMFWFFLAIIKGKSHGIWLKAPPDNYPLNEDGFWSLEAPKYLNEYKTAPLKESLTFSFERYPEKCFRLNKNRLPFGCHAWSKYDPGFWKKYLLKD